MAKNECKVERDNRYKEYPGEPTNGPDGPTVGTKASELRPQICGQNHMDMTRDMVDKMDLSNKR